EIFGRLSRRAATSFGAMGGGSLLVALDTMRKVGCMALLAGCAWVVPAHSQGVYSYVDGSGVKTLTNIPPQGPVQQLQLSPSALATLASLASVDPRSSLAGGAGKSSAR